MKSITVYCSASERLKPDFYELGQQFGREVAQRGLGLVYGGSNLGLMKRLANGALAAGGTVRGVMPQFLAQKEIAHHGLSELRLVEDMHERKMLMAQWGDAFVALPGGFGTLEELMEMLTWKQINQHDKPIVLLNLDGFWNPLLDFFDGLITQRLVSPEDRNLYYVSDSIEGVFTYLNSYWARTYG